MSSSSDSNEEKKEDKNNEENKNNFLKVVKEKEQFPCKFNNCVNLKQVLNYYDQNWGEGVLSEEENEGDDDSDKVNDNLKYVYSSSSS